MKLRGLFPFLTISQQPNDLQVTVLGLFFFCAFLADEDNSNGSAKNHGVPSFFFSLQIWRRKRRAREPIKVQKLIFSYSGVIGRGLDV